jgi:4-amino-4-deoxy-L-arabinose transferase-like glycosyltransferase
MSRIEAAPLPITPPAPSRSATRTGAALLVIVAAAAGLRFALLSHPPAWNDEAQVYRRACGSFADLVRSLQDDGFVPLLYEIDWLLARVLGGARRLTPAWLRALPAICGTLMPLAMYALARQLRFGRGTALLSASFAAVSAFLVAHSRDAKMYMPLWLACAAHVACLLHWRHARTRLAYLSWLASGVAMASLHATGLIVLAAEPLMLLGPRLRPSWRQWLLVAAGVAVILSGPTGYYLFSNRWAQRIDAIGWERGSGLQWIPLQNAGRGTLGMALNSASAYLFGWEWPGGAIPGQGRPGMPPAIFPVMSTLVVTLLALIVFSAANRLRKRSGRAAPDTAPDIWPLAAWLIVPLIAFGIAGDRLWVPRYLAIVWPAFALAVCPNLARLPWPPLRTYAFTVLFGVNLALAVCLVVVPTEPPVDRMIDDLLAADADPARATAAFFPSPDAAFSSFGHGGGSVHNHVGKYYFALKSRPIAPDSFYNLALGSITRIRSAAGPGPIAAAVRAQPVLRRLIVWDQLEATAPGRPLAEQLAGRWRLVREDRFTVRYLFTWSTMYTARRREWQRNE